MMNAIKSNNANSRKSNFKIFVTEAPNTFRMPISFVRCKVVNEARPNNPRQATNMARLVKRVNTCPKRWSALYCLSKWSSRKKYSNVFPGKNFLHSAFTRAMVSLALAAFVFTDMYPFTSGIKRRINGSYASRKDCWWKFSVTPSMVYWSPQKSIFLPSASAGLVKPNCSIPFLLNITECLSEPNSFEKGRPAINLRPYVFI